MKTYKNLYKKLYSLDNLKLAYRKARKKKSKKSYVVNFEKNVDYNLLELQKQLIDKTYTPSRLSRFIVRDPKTRTIHSSIFRDRIIHHAIVNILVKIYQPIFIYDSFASQKNKGSHKAVERFEFFANKISNGRQIKNSMNKNQVNGYVLKADFKRYFDSVNHEILIGILKDKIKDNDFIDLIRKVLTNFQDDIGMPLGNYTSQFFANVYLNEFDYYVKHILGVKYYIRYVDDFVIFHKDKRVLGYYLEHIKKFLPKLKIRLHPDKTQILPLRNGITFLGYRIFHDFKLLRKRNIRNFYRKIDKVIEQYNDGELTIGRLESKINGWFGYAKFADTYKLRKHIIEYINERISKDIELK